MTDDVDPQAPSLIQAICECADFGHPVSSVTYVETHMSWVVLTGQFAYKIKKPVKFAFADFSTLARRQHFCAEELKINRRFAPELYLDVVPIGGSRGRPVFGRKPAFEYAVKLEQFDAAMRLDKQLELGRVGAADVRALAQSICRLQERLPPVPPDSDFGSADFVSRLALTNLAELTPLLTDDPRWEGLCAWTRRQLNGLRPHFARRWHDGAIREGHGDLHLENLVRLQQHIVPFDALEFSLALRCMDTLDEVAFVAMDLMARDYPALAFEFLSHYLETSGDYAGVAVLRFYLVYRALVRAKVRALGQRPPVASGVPGDEPYLRLAHALITQQRPLLVLAHGFSGSGKTTVLGRLIGPLGALRLRSDLERKRLHGLAADAASGSAVGGGLYAAAATEQTYSVLAEHASVVLGAGFSVLVDAAFLQRTQRDRFRALAAAAGAPCVIVHCALAMSALRERIERRAATHDDASEATVAVLDQQLREHDPLARDERALTVRVDCGRRLDVDALVVRLAARRADAAS